MNLVRTAAVLGVVCASSAAQLGPITPPVGPVRDTGPDLGEVEPRIPLSPDTTPGDSSDRFIIRESGSYYLTGNVLEFGEGTNCIRINATDVTIDLMGFTITSVAVTPGTGILSDPGVGNLTVRNGTIRGWEVGINVDSIFQSRFEWVTVNDNNLEGLIAGNECQVFDCAAISNGATGFDLGRDSTVRGCKASRNGGSGFVLSNHANGTDCSANDNSSDGFDLNPGSLISNSRAALNTADGIDVGSDSLVTGCLSEDNEGIGIRANQDSRIERCSVTSNSAGGISGSLDTTVDSNTVTDNGLFGIQCNGGLIIRNMLSGNMSPQIVTGTAKFGEIITPASVVTTNSTFANIEY